MKLSNKVITAIVAVAVVLAALVIGFCIKEVRSRRAEVRPRVVAEPNRQLVEGRPTPGQRGERRFGELSPEERAKIKEQREQAIEKMASMSEEERERFRVQMRERFNFRRRMDSQRFRNLSEEERTRLITEREQWGKMRQEWESMSEKDRQEFLAEMRERLNARRHTKEVK